MVYGQTEVTRDLMDARGGRGADGLRGADVRLHDFDGPARVRHLRHRRRTACSRARARLRLHRRLRRLPRRLPRQRAASGASPTYEKVYPFGWLGILADVPPVSHELIYANTSAASRCARCAAARAAATTCSAADDKVEDWSDDRASGTSCAPARPQAAEALVTGPSIEKSIAPLRSFVAEPMRFGRLFLAGDAAHIVPPTGAKGLNLAAATCATCRAR
jgi:p-hydroxybenzoate 3-monooxygenase